MVTGNGKKPFSPAATVYLYERSRAFGHEVARDAESLAGSHDSVSKSHVELAEARWLPKGSGLRRSDGDAWILSAASATFGCTTSLLITWANSGSWPATVWVGLTFIGMAASVFMFGRTFPRR